MTQIYTDSSKMSKVRIEVSENENENEKSPLERGATLAVSRRSAMAECDCDRIINTRSLLMKEKTFSIDRFFFIREHQEDVIRLLMDSRLIPSLGTCFQFHFDRRV